MVPETWEAAVVTWLDEVRCRLDRVRDDNEEAFDARQHVEAAPDDEHYFRIMVCSDSGSWNIRDHPMLDTVEQWNAWTTTSVMVRKVFGGAQRSC